MHCHHALRPPPRRSSKSSSLHPRFLDSPPASVRPSAHPFTAFPHGAMMLSHGATHPLQELFLQLPAAEKSAAPHCPLFPGLVLPAPSSHPLGRTLPSSRLVIDDSQYLKHPINPQPTRALCRSFQILSRKMIGHPAIGMHFPIALGAALPQRLQPAALIHVALENRLLPISPVHHMIDRARILHSELERHSTYPCRGSRGQLNENSTITGTDPLKTP